MRKILLLLISTITATFVFANSAQRLQYIDQYKDLAISEMHRTGIPASIKLAQAILESNAGQSTLAREANNHFGIKCGSYWKGKTFYRKDDDRNARGKLVKSCFRSFKDPVASFIEHSDFLAEQNRRRYDFLFSYGTSDYTNWAYGLKKAGYATHKEYPQLLIKLIEEYQLYKYDNPGGQADVLAVATRPTYTKPTVTNTAPQKKKKKRKQPNIFDGGSAGEISMDAFRTKVATRVVNKTNVTFSTEGDHIGDIAARSGVSVKKLMKFNDNIDNSNQSLESGTQVYLAKKKTKFKGKRRFHYVQAEDNMISLSQQYGIQLQSLYAMNAMPLKSEPAVGEKIYLKGKLPKGKKVKTRILRVENPQATLVSRKVDNAPDATTEIVIETTSTVQPVIVEEVVTTPAPQSESSTANSGVVITWDDQPRTTTMETTQSTYYTVRKSDTLWNIAQRHGVTVDQIKSLNKLPSNTILIGQNLRIK